MQHKYTFVCQYCGKCFEDHNKDRFRKYCSPVCSSLAQRTSRTRVCLICNTVFEKKDKQRRLYCGQACESVAQSMRQRNTPERFWSHVDTSGGPNACWLWQRGKDKDGYGKVTWRGLYKRAHVVAYELTHGPVPEGMQVCHSCDTPACCQPNHLFAGSNSDNVADKVRKGRQIRGDRHGMSKLTYAKADAIRTRYARGDISQSRLALEYGVCQTKISAVVNFKTWVT